MLMATFAALAACNSHTVSEQPAPYRTVRADPHRDTEAARKANEEGLQYLARGELQQASTAFSRALTDDVEFGPAHNNLGKVYFKQKDWYKAAWEFEYARKLMPRQGEPRNNLGLVLEQGGELDRAVEHYRAAVELEGDNIQYRGNLARALVRRGERTDETRALLTEIADKDTRPDWVTWARQQLAAWPRQ